MQVHSRLHFSDRESESKALVNRNPKESPKRKLLVFSAVSGLFCLLSLSGCSLFYSSEQPATESARQHQVYLPQGQIIIARPMPSVSVISTERMLGFLPTRPELQGMWLRIERASSTVSLMEGERILFSSKVGGMENIEPGRYEILHKQRNPLWRANEEYYQKRSLPIPGEYDPDRLLRGVLGEFALFLSEELPIHCGPMILDEVGGLKLEEKEISQLYYSVEVGTPAVVL